MLNVLKVLEQKIQELQEENKELREKNQELVIKLVGKDILAGKASSTKHS